MERRTLLDLSVGGLGLTALAGLMLHSDPAEAQAAATRKLAERFAATLTAHDLAGFAALFAEDYKQHQPGTEPAAATPGAAKKGTVAYFAARLKALPDLSVTAAPIVATRDWVAANFTYTGTQKDTYFGVPATGRRVSFNSTDILRVADGKFVEHWGAADIAGLLRQLKS